MQYSQGCCSNRKWLCSPVCNILSIRRCDSWHLGVAKWNPLVRKKEIFISLKSPRWNRCLNDLKCYCNVLISLFFNLKILKMKMQRAHRVKTQQPSLWRSQKHMDTYTHTHTDIHIHTCTHMLPSWQITPAQPAGQPSVSKSKGCKLHLPRTLVAIWQIIAGSDNHHASTSAIPSFSTW